MTTLPVQFSEDQAAAFDSVTEMLRQAGVDLDDSLLQKPKGESGVMALMGKAGSGKTLLLAELYKALEAAGVDVVSGDYESRKKGDRRTLAILAPTNKAASVLRLRGVPATTIHRILYTPMYDPEYEKLAEWLTGKGEPPEIEGLTEEALARAAAFFEKTNPFLVQWRRLGCAGLISLQAGNAAKSRSILDLLMNPRCWMNASSMI